MLSSVPKHQKLFQIDYGSDSEEGEQEPQTERSHYADFVQHNIEKQNQSPETQQIQVVKLQRSYITERQPNKTDRPRHQPMRRNFSFKAKKAAEEDTKKIKPAINKSVSKFVNIFQEVEQMEARTSGQFAVHEQNQKEQNMNIDATASSSFSNSITLDIIKKTQESPVLRISNFIKPQNKKNDAMKKEVSFMDHSNISQKLGRKTGYCQKSVLNGLLEKKLYEKVQHRPTTTANEPKKELKAPLRVEQVTDMDAFAHKKIGSSYLLLTRLTRIASGLNWLWPEYHLRDEKSNVHILSAKKKAANTTSNYYISRSQKQIDVQNDKYMGKIRANFVGSCFNIFNKGLNPESDETGSKDKQNVRKLLASVIYESQLANSNPKSVRVYMIKPQYNYYDLEGTSIKSEQKSLEKLYEIGQNKAKIWLFVNRKATYQKKLNRFVLGFDGRVKLPSTKNFILQDAETKREVLMFGKVQTNEYMLHISSPLTPHIALGIVLAEMDNKIVCD